MYRIGIIGTENSHAMAFAKIMEKDYPEKARVVGVMGPDGSAEKIRDEVRGVEFVAQDASEFFGKVDAMMITCRHGSKHAAFARMFIETGMPVFIDKPLTSNYDEALELLKFAKAKKVPVSGGSGCKYTANYVPETRDQVKQLRAEGGLLSASINFSADVDSEYDGFHFYSPHLAEIALTVLGSDIQSVQATHEGNAVLVTARYPGFLAALHFLNGTKKTNCLLYTKDGNVSVDGDGSRTYDEEVKHFIHMLDTGEMPQTYEELFRPVQLICAIIESFKAGGKIVPCPAIGI